MMGAQIPARQVYDRIVQDFQFVLREYHSCRLTFDAKLLAKHTEHFRSRLRQSELPVPQTNLIMSNDGKKMEMQLYLDPETDAFLDQAWAEEV